MVPSVLNQLLYGLAGGGIALNLIEDNATSTGNERNAGLKLQTFKKVRDVVAFLERTPVCPYLLSLGGKVYVDESLVFLLREPLDKMGFPYTSCTLHKKCGLSGKVLFPGENLAISLALKLYCRIIHRCTFIFAHIVPNPLPLCQCSCHEILIVYYNKLSRNHVCCTANVVTVFIDEPPTDPPCCVFYRRIVKSTVAVASADGVQY